MDNNSMVEKIYEETGMGQRHLAFYAGAKQSTLSRYEDGSRTMPAEAMIEIAELFTMVSNLPEPNMPQPSKEEKAEMLGNAAWYRMQCYPLEKQLKAMQRAYKQAHKMLQTLNNYKVDKKPLTEKKQRWVDEQVYQTEKRLARNGWRAQRQLQMQIDMYNYQASLCAAAAQ